MSGLQSKRRMANSRFEMSEYDFEEQQHYVRCSACGGEHNVNDVVLENVEEDIQGRDVAIFVCPVTSEIARSFVFRGHR